MRGGEAIRLSYHGEGEVQQYGGQSVNRGGQTASIANTEKRDRFAFTRARARAALAAGRMLRLYMRR